MEHHFGLQNKTRVSRISKEVNNRSIDSRKNLGYILKFEKNDEDSEIVENVKRSAKQNEEVIRYMSNLPSFLEKGKDVKERAFTVGVLDWRLLEKWQNSRNIGNNVHSPSSSYTSSFSSTSSQSSSSPACKKTDYPTLQSHLYASCDSESSQDCKDGPSDASNIKKVTEITRLKVSDDFKGKMKVHEDSYSSNCENDSIKVKEKTPLKNIVETKPSKIGTVDATKVRNHSPIRRFMGKISKISSSSVEESKTNGKRSSSPLRRLLDPLIKPKAINSDDLTMKDKRGESVNSNSMKMKINLKHCKKIDAEDPHNNKKDKSSTVQALLQVAVKNGVPLYTFAVDNKSEILAATMKKDEYSWIYTFFFVNDSKKKKNGYVPSVVAQMRIANDLNSNVKEFVLFATDRRQGVNLDLNDELAGIIVKVAEKMVNMTVIFPGGNHGVPIKGEPSSLIRRWKSGGSCDCGGWDLGCQLRVLANEKNGREPDQLGQPDLCDRFELFHQGEEVEQKAVFSLSSFKDGIYSVEFDSSMKFLEAFSISLAALRCCKLTEFSETSNLFGDKVEVPVKYVSHPPLSPVGRV